MKRLAFYFIIIAGFMASGCTATYQKLEIANQDSTTILDRGRSVFIITPQDGYYGSKVSQGSGQMTAQAIKSAFSRFTNKIKISNNCSDLEPCLETAIAENYGYLIYPEILHWEERATEWSGKPDRIEVKISLFDLSTSNQINSVIIKGKSKWATFGGDHPQDLLPDPINSHISTLY